MVLPRSTTPGLARSGDGKVAGDGVGIVSVGEQRERAQILLDKSESDPDELLMQSGRFLEMLADLAQADAVPTCRLVTRCLANLAGHERMRVNLVQAGLLRSIVQAGQHEDTRVSTPASSALNLLGVYSVHTLDRLVQMTGVETLRYGPMKGVGLDNPYDTTEEHPQGRWPYAVVQLRQDNKLGTLWNMVGFQTKLKYGAQVELFRTIPGLENAEFARLGGLHRNTFINSPLVLDRQLRLRGGEHIRFAGQITGCEGYVESSAVGLMAGLMAAAELAGRDWSSPPRTTAFGALLSHITGDAEAATFQPMNVNFGLFPPLHDVGKKVRKEAYTNRAKADFGEWLAGMEAVPA